MLDLAKENGIDRKEPFEGRMNRGKGKIALYPSKSRKDMSLY